MAKNHKISIFFDNRNLRFLMPCHDTEIQNALVSKGRMLLSWKVLNINLIPLVPDEGETFYSGSLVLDLRIWWHHMNMLYEEATEAQVIDVEKTKVSNYD